ncbi:hypothetical protein HZA87_05705 [Candidatus Uhrbacteria bacterium]|nr:hypothetical protein [Candidatus Uhrbacteria bacterium]
MFILQAVLLVSFPASLSGCAQETPGSVDTADNILNADGEYDGMELGVEADAKGSVTKTYYIYNPTSGGCSSALKLTAKGTKITKIVPLGCVVNGTGATAHPSWTTLTSGGTSPLSATWYDRKYDTFTTAATSANWYDWCGSTDLVTVKVTGTSVSSLSYWFTDSSSCVF